MTIKALLTVLILLVAACGGKEEREAAYLERGIALFEQGDLVKARLEFRNALQINPKSAKGLYYMGRIHEQEANWQEAYRFFALTVQEDPDNVDAHVKLAHLYLLGNDLDKVEEQVATLERLAPETANLYALRSSLAMRRGRRHEAQLLAEGALAKDPAHVGAAMVLASSLAGQGDLPAALTTLETAIDRSDDDAPLRLLSIKLLLDANRFDDAVAAYDQLIEQAPDNFQYRLSLAQLYASRDRIDDAERVLRAAVDAGVGGNQANVAVVDLLAQRSGVDAAEAELKRLIAAAPEENAFAFKLADLYAGSARPDEATAVLTAVVDRVGDSPDGLTARVALARLALGRDDVAKARSLIEEVLAGESGNADALLIRGALALNGGDVDGALADARSVLRYEPRSAPALRLLSQTHLRRGETQLAMETLGQLIDVEPDTLDAREQLAALHARQGELEPALDLYDAVLARAPNRPQTLLPRAEILIALERWADADAAIEAILAIPDQAAAGHLLSGRRYQARGSIEPAVGEFKAAAALRPDAAEPLAGIVQTYLSVDRYDDALAYLEGVIDEQPTNAMALNLKGEVLSRQRRVDEADAAFAAAIAVQPDWDVPYQNRGGMLSEAGQGAAAIDAFNAGLERLPDNLALLFALAAAQERVGGYADAIATYERILGIEADSELASNNFAALVADFAYDDVDRLTRAIDLARRFERSDNPYFLDTLGWLHYRTGDHGQARAYLDRAVGLGGDLPVIRYHLGMALFQLGDRPGARRELEAALAEGADFPGRDEAERTLAELSQS